MIFTGLSLNATLDQVAVTQQGQYADRYSRAIEQLGHEGPNQTQIRLGAIYALERLARDSPPDQPSILEVLNVFVRQNVARTSDPDRRPYKATCPDAPESAAVDVQAALRVMGRRDTTQDGTTSINLSRTCLRGIALNEANLAGVDMTAADLSGVDLSGAKLEGTHLDAATVEEADLTDADLDGANLAGANLFGAQLKNANLTDADLSCADLAGTLFHGAHLSGANLECADLFGAALDDADLTGANLTRANLDNAFLTGTDLTMANLSGVTLVGVNLNGANLNGVIRDQGTVVEHAYTDNSTRGQWW